MFFFEKILFFIIAWLEHVLLKFKLRFLAKNFPNLEAQWL